MSSLTVRLEPEQLAELARLVADEMRRNGHAAPADEADAWLTSAEAAAHVRLSLSELQRRAATREIPSQQDVPGGRRYYRRSELDAWRAGRG